MKFILVSIFVVLGISACSTKHNPNGSYDRANNANEKALQGLEKDTK